MLPFGHGKKIEGSPTFFAEIALKYILFSLIKFNKILLPAPVYIEHCLEPRTDVCNKLFLSKTAEARTCGLVNPMCESSIFFF